MSTLHVKAFEANPLGSKVDDSETMGYLCSLGAFCLVSQCLTEASRVCLEGRPPHCCSQPPWGQCL